MRLGLLGFGLACMVWHGAVAAPADQIEALETTASAHVATFSTLAAERTNLALRYRALIETLTQRLKFGTAAKNPTLVNDLQDARAALAALGATAEPLSALSAELTDDAAAVNALARALRAAPASAEADEAGQGALAARIEAASETIDRALGQALEQRRKQSEMLKAEQQDLANLSRAIDAGHLPTTDPTLADMLTPPQLIAPPADNESAARPAGNPGRWVIEFGQFATEDDATFTMARLSIQGTPSRFVAIRDKHGHAGFKVVTRPFPTREAAEAAAAALRRHDLHPSGVVEAAAR
ncbi:MAG: SPOR domain-containing protein [Aliidongia sp.]